MKDILKEMYLASETRVLTTGICKTSEYSTITLENTKSYVLLV